MMTPEQAAAFVQAQTVCAAAEIAAMHAANREREMQGYTHAYGEDSFLEVPNTFGIDYKAVIQLFNECNET